MVRPSRDYFSNFLSGKKINLPTIALVDDDHNILTSVSIELSGHDLFRRIFGSGRI